MAASWLLEAEMVTADGAVQIANACTNPELFWGLKGGGGGSLGVVTRLTLRTHDLTEWFGAAFLTVKATSRCRVPGIDRGVYPALWRASVQRQLGESVAIRRDDTLAVSMVSLGLDKTRAAATWQPFLQWVASTPQDYRLGGAPFIASVPARKWWDAEFLRANAASAIFADTRPGAPSGNIWWAGDHDQVGAYWHGYESAWLPASLLAKEQQERLVDALFAASRQWTVSLHFNKGLAGAPEAALAAARDTATNPAAFSAFALAIIAGGGPPAYPGVPGHIPDFNAARPNARAIARAMVELRKVVPEAASYVSESSYFEQDWQRAHWGANYPRLQAVKGKYDPDGLFFVHHGSAAKTGAKTALHASRRAEFALQLVNGDTRIESGHHQD